MNIINLQIEKIIIHQIFQRDPDGNKVMPLKSTEFINFDSEAMSTFKSRVIEALGGDSRAVQMTIASQGEGTASSVISTLSEASDSVFIDKSFELANMLADAQTRKNLPGGIVAVFRGTFGASRKKFVGLIKAEIYSAYQKVINQQTNELTLRYVQEALLTPATKLYKTAGFFEKDGASQSEDLNSYWDVLLSDTQISQADGKAAAQYFYAGFLGCGYPASSARTTKLFYEATKDFLNDMDISDEKDWIFTMLLILT